VASPETANSHVVSFAETSFRRKIWGGIFVGVERYLRLTVLAQFEEQFRHYTARSFVIYINHLF
jgi:hypothetical protein